MFRAFFLSVCLLSMSACGVSVRPAASPPVSSPESVQPPSEPAEYAVIPFENKTGNPDLNWLRTALSATLSSRLKDRRGMTTVDGSFVGQVMGEQGVAPSLVLTSEQAIALSGSLYAESLIAGAFEGRERELILTASVFSGETGTSVKSVTVSVQNNDRSRAINQLIDELTGVTPTPERSVLRDATDGGRARTRTIRPPIETAVEGFKSLSFDSAEEVERSIKSYRMILENNPEFADAHFAVGYGYDKQGDTEKAIAAYRQAVTLNPLNVDYLYTLGYAYERTKDYRKAIEYYKAAFAITPNDAEIAFALAFAHEKIGEYAEAITGYRQAIALNPVDYEAHEGLASAFEAGGQLNQALEQYHKLMELRPTDPAPTRTFISVAVRMQRWDDAVAACRALIEKNPRDVETREVLAQVYRSQGDIGQAIAAYQEIVRVDPGNASAHISLGNIYVRQKQYDRAVAQYRAGIRAVPLASLLYYNLGNVLTSSKDYRGALEAYDGYLKNDPAGEYVPGVRKKIDELRLKVMKEQ